MSNLRRRVPQRVRDLLRPDFPEASRPWLQGSFSQAGEDRIVRFLFDVLGLERPSYLDVGAYHPFQLSNTALFSLTGSGGVNVDPDPDAIANLRRYRPRDVNLNVGIGPEPGELTFFRMNLPTLNTFDRGEAEQVRESSGGIHHVVETITVPVRTMADVLDEMGSCPDFMSLDAEGFDLAILRTMPSWPFRPTVVCVETVRSAGHLTRASKDEEIPALMSDYGYIRQAETPINTVFVLADRWRKAET